MSEEPDYEMMDILSEVPCRTVLLSKDEIIQRLSNRIEKLEKEEYKYELEIDRLRMRLSLYEPVIKGDSQ